MPTYTDDFNRANSASLGASWYSEFGIVSNQAEVNTSSSGSRAHYLTELSSGDMFASADVTITNTFQQACIHVRVTDTTNYYRMRVDRADGGRVYIDKVISGSATQLATATTTIALNTTYLYRFEAQGTTLRAYINGALIVTTTDSALAGGVGSRKGGMSGDGVFAPTKFDNFSTGTLGAGVSAPVAAFTFTPSGGVAPTVISFTDTSTNTPTSWSWSFGDGGTSTSQNPSHTYTSAGTFTVTLTATNAGGSDGETHTLTITAPEEGGGGETSGAVRSGAKFGCGLTEVWICDRALRKPLVQVNFQRAEWGRELSVLSAASVDVPEAWCSPLTSDALDGRIETWKHGLMVIRDGEIQWRGPVIDVARPVGSEVVNIQARDKMAWLDFRFVEIALEYELIDDASMFDALLLEGVRRDNRFRLSSSSRTGGAAVKRSYPANGTTSVLSLMADLTQADMEWTVVDDRLVSGVDLWRDFGQLAVSKEAFSAKIGCRLDGLSRGNSWKISGAQGETDKIFGQWEEWTTETGLLQKASEEQGLLDSPAAVELARSRVLRNKLEPVVVELPALSVNFPATMAEIAPGQRLDLAAEDPVFSLAGRYRVVQLKVAVTQDESGQTETANIGIEEFI